MEERDPWAAFAAKSSIFLTETDLKILLNGNSFVVIVCFIMN